MMSRAGIFPCPSCGEMIYSDVTTCRFCSAPMDAEAAARGASLQKQVNNACNQAKVLRHFAVSMWVFLLVSLVLGTAFWAFVVLMIVIPGWLIYWHFTFSKLETGDADYTRAKRDHLIALLSWLPSPIALAIRSGMV